MNTKLERLIDEYVNFNIDSLSLATREEMLYSYMVDEYNQKTEDEIIAEITHNYGIEWFQERNLTEYVL
jgi:hypothetical protein